MLLAGGAVQLHAAVALAQALHPILQLLFVAAGHRQGERRAQQRRAVAATQHRLQFARRQRALGRLGRGTVLACGLLAGDLVGVDLALGDLLARLAVGDELDRERGVDREAELQRREHQLRRGAGHKRFLGHRAEDQQRLVGAAALGVDRQRATLEDDAALVQAQEVIAVGLEALLATGVEEAERLRREALIDVGLAEAAGVGAADQARQPPRPDAAAFEVAEHPLEGGFLLAAQGGDLAGAEAARLLEAEALGERPPERRRPVEEAAERARTSRRRQPHREVDLRAQGFAAFELRAVFGEMGLEALALAVARVERGQGAALVGLGVEGAGDAEDLEVGLDRVSERLKALAYLDLALLGEARVALAFELIDGPSLGRGAEDEVGPEEVVGRPHSGSAAAKITVRPAGTSSVLPRCRGTRPAGLSRQSLAAARRSAEPAPVPLGTRLSATWTG